MDEYQVWCLSWDQRCNDSITIKAYRHKRAAEEFVKVICNNQEWIIDWPIKIAVQLDVNKKSHRSRKVKIFNVGMISNPSFVAVDVNMKKNKEDLNARSNQKTCF